MLCSWMSLSGCLECQCQQQIQEAYSDVLALGACAIDLERELRLSPWKAAESREGLGHDHLM